MTREKRLSKAVALFKDFRGDGPDFVDEIEIDLPDTALVIGKLDAVMYTTMRDGKKTIVSFISSRLPPNPCFAARMMVNSYY